MKSDENYGFIGIEWQVWNNLEQEKQKQRKIVFYI